MTEEEAKLKDCPFFRYCVNEAGVIQDRDGPIYVHARCNGSECIAWRWELDFNELVKRFPNKSAPELRAIADGYCGVSGRPS